MPDPECYIRFDNNQYGVYLAGQTLAGQVELRVTEIVSVVGVSLQLNGVTEIEWSEVVESTGQPGRKTTRYHGQQTLLNSISFLCGSSAGPVRELAIGTHTYHFSCELPSHLPTAFEGYHARIRYMARVALHRSKRHRFTGAADTGTTGDQIGQTSFTVLRHLNLNEHGGGSSVLALPVKSELTKVFCCGPCSSEPLYISAAIPRCGYIPGQTIVIKIDAVNRSRTRVNEFRIKLVQKLSYTSQQPAAASRSDALVVAESRCSGVTSGEVIKHQQNLLIPALAPTYTDGASIFSIDYELEVEARVTGPNISPRLSMPITIGTIALEASVPKETLKPLTKSPWDPFSSQQYTDIIGTRVPLGSTAAARRSHTEDSSKGVGFANNVRLHYVVHRNVTDDGH
ncbi:arrestin domain-containing protein 3-like [Anopheles bellator]|uniref:arrestin domain-containing protein 3-like n=1 Tax=Anopheles bellator TaxID=139047 RepID=UPI0026480B9A|nr:arrestin domain-containing protein 3-like [Anopheles bellator]